MAVKLKTAVNITALLLEINILFSWFYLVGELKKSVLSGDYPNSDAALRNGVRNGV